MADQTQNQTLDISSASEYKNEAVMNFMRQTVKEKYGEGVELDFLNQEANKIYTEFENSIFDHFKPMLSPDQQVEIDKITNEQADQATLLAFLMQSIKNFEFKIAKFLVDFRKKYQDTPRLSTTKD